MRTKTKCINALKRQIRFEILMKKLDERKTKENFDYFSLKIFSCRNFHCATIKTIVVISFAFFLSTYLRNKQTFHEKQHKAITLGRSLSISHEFQTRRFVDFSSRKNFSKRIFLFQQPQSKLKPKLFVINVVEKKKKHVEHDLDKRFSIPNSSIKILQQICRNFHAF